MIYNVAMNSEYLDAKVARMLAVGSFPIYNSIVDVSVKTLESVQLARQDNQETDDMIKEMYGSN